MYRQYCYIIYDYRDRNIRQYCDELKTNWKDASFLGTICRWMPWGCDDAFCIKLPSKMCRKSNDIDMSRFSQRCHHAIIHFLTAGCCRFTRVRSYRILGILTMRWRAWFGADEPRKGEKVYGIAYCSTSFLRLIPCVVRRD